MPSGVAPTTRPAAAQRGSVADHYDHVHVTTIGGGYPTGAEIYYPLTSV